jgi:tRNA modification GTPase
MIHQKDTIVALSTGSNNAAIALIRMSGNKSVDIINKYFNKKIDNDTATHKARFGSLYNNDILIDEVVVTYFKGPNTYTGEDVIEIACHGSTYIINTILDICIAAGARLANAGEYTQRAFLNGKMNLAQAEAVADLIASETTAQHKLAMQQMRGKFGSDLQEMRNELIHFVALIELELDFSDEDVAFANRDELIGLLDMLMKKLEKLKQSFKLGNAIKKGIPIAIVGEPNAGKSTLLNLLLNEEKAIVSEIAGTTRDFIEDTIIINGTAIRFIDTAGIRNTEDVVEKIGVARSFEKIKEASIILVVVDAAKPLTELNDQINSIIIDEGQQKIIVVNKIDIIGACNGYDVEEALATLCKLPAIAISAKTNMHIEKIMESITNILETNNKHIGDVVISNIRHADAIENTLASLNTARHGLKEGLSGDLVSVDLREALYQLGNITGEVEIDRDILGAIFGKFCIGK